jgi:MFS family permease
MLFMPVIVLFYKDNGLNMQQIFTLLAIGSLTTVILEIPSGYLADLWGRKNTILVGCIADFAGFIIYSISSNFWGFGIGELLLGIGQSMVSGADSAILYDTLAEEKKEKEYLKNEGKMVSVGNFAESIAGIIGGLLASVSLRLPFIVQIGITSIAIPASALLYEPKIHKFQTLNRLNNLLHIIKDSLLIDKKLQIVILYSSMIGSATLTMAWFVQPFFNKINIPLPIYGILWSLLNASVGLTAFSSHKLLKIFNIKNSLLLITLLIPILYLLLGINMNKWAISLIFIFYLIRGFATPLLKDMLNKIAPSGIRATILSIRNLIIRLIFSIIGPILGWISDNFNLSSAFVFAGIFYLIALIALLIILFKRDK